MAFKLKINKEREFATAYRLFSYLGETPISAAKCGSKHGIPHNLLQLIIKNMKQRGLVMTKLGNNVGGTYKAPGATVKTLFEKYEMPFQEGAEFEKKIDSILSKYTKDKKCCVCGKYSAEVTGSGYCKKCNESVEVVSSVRKARCGHFSLTRYFKCENCQPVLEDNTTPDDWGVGMIT